MIPGIETFTNYFSEKISKAFNIFGEKDLGFSRVLGRDKSPIKIYIRKFYCYMVSLFFTAINIKIVIGHDCLYVSHRYIFIEHTQKSICLHEDKDTTQICWFYSCRIFTVPSGLSKTLFLLFYDIGKATGL